MRDPGQSADAVEGRERKYEGEEPRLGSEWSKAGARFDGGLGGRAEYTPVRPIGA